MTLTLVSCGGDDGDESNSAGERVPDTTATPIIVDYSPSISDVPALLYLTQRDDVDLRAVTIPGTGESHCEFAVPNTRSLLTLAGQPDVPVACGQTEPIGPGNSWPDEFRERSDSLNGLDLRPVGDVEGAGELDAVDLLAQVTAETDEAVTVITLGPLTNLARAIERDPDIVDKIEMVYSMGGALNVEGNAPNGVAEWNYYVDPTAVDVVLRSGVSLTIVPLDATDEVPSTREWFNALARHHTTPHAEAVHALFAEQRPYDFDIDFWDEFTAAVALNEGLATIEELTVSIDLEGDSQAQLKADPDGSPIRVAVAADRKAFEPELLTTLNGGAPAPEVVPADGAELTYFDGFAESIATFNQGAGSIFQTPLAIEVETLFEDDPPEELSDEQEMLIRRFGRQLWSTAAEILVSHHAELIELHVPAAVEGVHINYVNAVDSFIVEVNVLLGQWDDFASDELVENLLQDGPSALELMDQACAAIYDAAVERNAKLPSCSDQ